MECDYQDVEGPEKRFVIVVQKSSFHDRRPTMNHPLPGTKFNKLNLITKFESRALGKAAKLDDSFHSTLCIVIEHETVLL
jgi:hypothetical protein